MGKFRPIILTGKLSPAKILEHNTVLMHFLYKMVPNNYLNNFREQLF